MTEVIASYQLHEFLIDTQVIKAASFERFQSIRAIEVPVCLNLLLISQSQMTFATLPTRILIIIESDLTGFSRLVDDSIPCDCFPNNESVETAV